MGGAGLNGRVGGTGVVDALSRLPVEVEASDKEEESGDDEEEDSFGEEDNDEEDDTDNDDVGDDGDEDICTGGGLKGRAVVEGAEEDFNGALSMPGYFLNERGPGVQGVHSFEYCLLGGGEGGLTTAGADEERKEDGLAERGVVLEGEEDIEGLDREGEGEGGF